MVKCTKYLILSFLVIIFSLSTINNTFVINSQNQITTTPNYRTVATYHDPIYIKNDAELASAAAESGGGSGNFSFPYIIENWLIMSANEHGIQIENTTKFFKIQNCEINTGDGETSAGIFIDDVPVVTATIYNNIIEHSHYGIRVLNSPNCEINANEISDCSIGIQVQQSDDFRIYNTDLIDNSLGIKIEQSHNVIMRHNEIYSSTEGIYITQSNDVIVRTCTLRNNLDYGIKIVSSNGPQVFLNTIDNSELGFLVDNSQNLNISFNDFLNNENNQITYCVGDNVNNVIHNNSFEFHSIYGLNTKSTPDLIIENNSFTNCGLYVEEPSLANYQSYSVENNTVNGKNLGYLENKTSIPYNPDYYGQLILINCSDLTIRDQMCNYASIGLFIYEGDSITIKDSTFNHNLFGIWGYESNNLTVDFCLTSYNTEYHGIYLDHCYYANLINNSVQFNNQKGIYLDVCLFSEVKYNIVMNNSEHGINLKDCTLSEVGNNTCKYNNFYGIVSNSMQTVIANNTLDTNYYSNVGYGIQSTGDDCTIEHNFCTSTPVAYQPEGIRVNGDNLIVRNNTIEGSESGIFCHQTTNSLIANNSITNCYYGINSYESTSLTIQDNYIETGVHLYTAGIHFFDSQSSTISDNTFIGSGIVLEDRNSYLDNILTEDNTINGKPLGFYRNANDITIDESNKYGQLILFNCDSVNIAKQNFMYTSSGMIIYESQFCRISNSTFEHNNNGILSIGSTNITYFHNRFAYNYLGLYLKSSGYTTSYLNTFLLNDYNFARENPTNPDIFYNETYEGRKGNYWSGNDSDGFDPYSAPVVPVIISSGEYLEFMESDEEITHTISWTLESDDNPREYELYQNQVRIDNGVPFEGFVYNRSLDSLTVGEYQFMFVVTDWDDFVTTCNISVRVKKAPILSSPDDLTVEFQQNGNLTWIAIDENPDTYEVFFNGVVINQGYWSSGEDIIYSWSLLIAGTYNITLVVTDADGLQAKDTVILTVNEQVITSSSTTDSSSNPTTSTSPETTTETEESTSLPPLETSPSMDIIIAIMGLLGGFGLFKKKRR